MSSKTIEPIQQLRGIAALGVVLYHAVFQMFEPGAVQSYAQLGEAGVDLFFVISGFIMWVTAANRDERPGRFVVKRLVRIVPLYWLITSFVVLVVLVAPELMRSASFSAAHTAASFGFVALPHPRFDHQFWPTVVPGWTLNYEMAFYAIVTVSLFLQRRWRAYAIGATLASLVLFGHFWKPEGSLAFYTDSILLEFLLGIAIGTVYTRWGHLRRGSAYTLLAVGIVLFVLVGPHYHDTNRVLTFGIPMAIVLLGAIYVPVFLPRRPFLLLGDASYSIYLTQFLTISPSTKIMLRFADTPLERAAGAVTIMLIAVVAGVAVYRCIEKPITKVVKQLVERAEWQVPARRERNAR
jgi:exopolysaccharide production protein ExoZ